MQNEMNYEMRNFPLLIHKMFIVTEPTICCECFIYKCQFCGKVNLTASDVDNFNLEKGCN